MASDQGDAGLSLQQEAYQIIANLRRSGLLEEEIAEIFRAAMADQVFADRPPAGRSVALSNPAQYAGHFGYINLREDEIMLCDHCHANEANIQMRLTRNNETTDLNLCPACAAKLQSGGGAFPPLFDSFFSHGWSGPNLIGTALFGSEAGRQAEPVEALLPLRSELSGFPHYRSARLRPLLRDFPPLVGAGAETCPEGHQACRPFAGTS